MLNLYSCLCLLLYPPFPDEHPCWTLPDVATDFNPCFQMPVRTAGGGLGKDPLHAK